MSKNTKLQFKKRYQAALRHRLSQRSPKRSTSSSAHALGRAAASLGLDAVTLARMHDRTMAALASSSNNDGNGNAPLTEAGKFFLEVLTPIEQRHHAAESALSHEQRLVGMLRERTAALAVMRRKLRREIERRKAGEQQLVHGARHYNQLLERSRRMQEESRRLAHQVLLAQEEERREISRELHDEVAQILAGINVRLAALREAAAENTKRLRQRIAQTQRLVEQSVEVVHRFARELRPALLDDLGLIPALRSFIKDMPGRKGLRIRFTAFSGVEALDNTRRTVLYRVAQEALTNVARHARAQLVTVTIHRLPGAVRLEVRDNGKSFPAERVLASNTRKRLGLLGMRERVEMVGGTFAIESAPGKGTAVRAEIPFPGKPGKEDS